ncbi:TIGR04325 family methyltransferase [Methylocapsa aurea]|uniref:TIGR04325 family methyltransferase n=1 Tax=Methylocapsa aurea TaxID=663610 RepID=UPI00068D7133|nr:TIGR04325 family methyltransferase [Methylocapsa aurea]
MNARSFAKVVLGDTVVGAWIGRAPFLERAYKHWAMSRRDSSGLYYGVYNTYEEAFADLPSWRAAGWDNDGAAAMWVDNISPIRAGTYPVFFWLSQLLHEGSIVIDYGGSIGLTYYGFRRYAHQPADLRWIVVEVPRIAEQGRCVAKREAAASIEFETALEAVPDGDVLLALGSLQYMKQSVPGLLELRATNPPHVILNKVPLTQGNSYWTLQNFGPSICPYRVYNEADFIGYFEQAGYRLKDRWGVYELDCYVPFHPHEFLPFLTGLYFKKPA